MKLTDTPDWSNNKIDQVGKAIRDGKPYEEDLYQEFLFWSGDIIDSVADLMRDCLSISEKEEVVIPRTGLTWIDRANVKLSGRVKTFDTTRDKLQRLPNFKLSRIQDICGLRLDGTFSLYHQTQVAHILDEVFTKEGARKVEIKDLRESPHNGYRAVHVHATFPAGRIEVQIRTELQSAWANAYEVAGDIYGRNIRYEENFDMPYPGFQTHMYGISGDAYQIDHSIERIDQSLLKVQHSLLMMPAEHPTRKLIDDQLAIVLGSRVRAVENRTHVVDSLEAFKSKLVAQRYSNEGEEARPCQDS